MNREHARISGWCVMVGGIAVGACAGPADRETAGAPLAQEASALNGTLQKLVKVFPPGGSPSNIALLTDGRVLCGGPETSNSWYTLTPDANGSYVNGNWNQVASSHLGHEFNPSFVLRDGRYFLCGGEYVSDPTEKRLHASGQDLARCEIYDPVNDSWQTVSDMPQTVADSPGVVQRRSES